MSLIQVGIPSPNPDYPQKVETVGSSVEIDIMNKNVFDSSIFKSTTKDGVTITNENGIITLNGTYTGTGNWNYIFSIPTLKGNYILSMNRIDGSQTLVKGNGLRFSLWEKDFSNVWASIENQNFNKTLSEHSYIQASRVSENMVVGPFEGIIKKST